MTVVGRYAFFVRPQVATGLVTAGRHFRIDGDAAFPWRAGKSPTGEWYHSTIVYLLATTSKPAASIASLNCSGVTVCGS
jgi:hypothetical protein